MSTANYPSTALIFADAAVTTRHRRHERREIASRQLIEQRVLAEFREMPCLRLTPDQAERLFGLRSDISDRVIARLIDSGKIRVDDDGRYALAVLE